MLHTNLEGQWPFGSGEDFKTVITIHEYGRGGQLGQSCDPDLASKLSSPHPTETPYLHLGGF